ncbi:MAG: hypothetical protein CO125_07530 [Hydrogenophilales bacterium CG_4_9_14_3_um_filter_59_35]|nr:MAG: hypothetical protein COW70_07895 [Hydrogenophilales bacterium CG18_big_fil_WC_8_21_14_2_50_58_12]PIY01421.1 MAG: hypothetical protein COZ23_03280 [Hydrogenophilales bacterium CG_4_10_14_3_um_filter_58_23]PJB06180.1 MAG: hypothetical protein CO125_07530 [Hydrogenophilales bacterium CG_4_9_14_3_um_filter_59_35]
MRLRRVLKRRFSIAASPLAVRRHVAWHWRLLLMGVLLAGGIALSWFFYDAGMRFAGLHRGATADELQRLRERLGSLERENASLRSDGAQSERKGQIEQATQNDLAKTVKTLQDENAHLKEDLTFFRKQMSSDKSDADLSIYRFKVENTMPGEYRYRLLLLQGGQREHEFQGKVQFLVSLTQGGEKLVMTLPSAKEAEAHAYNLNFKYYQRLEGVFHTEPKAQVRKVQIRVFENGAVQPKLMQIVNLS